MFVLAGVVVLYFTDLRGGLRVFGTSIGLLSVLWIVVVSPKARKAAGRVWRFFWKHKLILAGRGTPSCSRHGWFCMEDVEFSGKHHPRDLCLQPAIVSGKLQFLRWKKTP